MRDINKDNTCCMEFHRRAQSKQTDNKSVDAPSALRPPTAASHVATVPRARMRAQGLDCLTHVALVK